MQLPIGPDPRIDRKHEGGGLSTVARSGMVLSIESQLKLRELYDYVEASGIALNRIRTDLSLLESNPGCLVYSKKASERLENFCIEADSWGFNSLYEVSLGLQMLLLEAGNRMQSEDFWKALDRGLATLSALLEQCESDFLWRLAIADTLECINQAARM